MIIGASHPIQLQAQAHANVRPVPLPQVQRRPIPVPQLHAPRGHVAHPAAVPQRLCAPLCAQPPAGHPAHHQHAPVLGTSIFGAAVYAETPPQGGGVGVRSLAPRHVPSATVPQPITRPAHPMTPAAPQANANANAAVHGLGVFGGGDGIFGDIEQVPTSGRYGNYGVENQVLRMAQYASRDVDAEGVFNYGQQSEVADQVRRRAIRQAQQNDAEGIFLQGFGAVPRGHAYGRHGRPLPLPQVTPRPRPMLTQAAAGYGAGPDGIGGFGRFGGLGG